MNKNYDEALRRIQEAHLSRATKLELDKLELITLPSKLWELTDLRFLNLCDNNLTELPSGIGQLTNLDTLVLGRGSSSKRSNQFITLPSELVNLLSLDQLVLENNGLNNLPDVIYQLSSLKYLHLSHNNFHDFPTDLVYLTSLTHLSLRSNNLSSVPPEIALLTSLTSLNLSSNNLSDLPPEFAHLSMLNHLRLNSNNLHSLPLEITQLTRLWFLGLDSNNLNSLPIEINNLTHLLKLFLRWNPNLNIPPEVTDDYENPAAILAYYFENIATSKETKPLNEVKVLVVGQGRVGKTSLIGRLTRNHFDTQEDITDGIDIHKWPLLVGEDEMQLNVWDFGGQEIYHATHQFFLTERSLYLLVLDAGQDEEQNAVDYWLELISTYGGESPVIIISNKIDQHKLDLNRRRLREGYDQIVGFAETSASTGQGIGDLADLIAQTIDGMDHVRSPFSHRWWAIKEQIENMEEDFITYDQYVALCAKHTLDEADSQDSLIRFLHALGVTHYYDALHLRDTYILNPGWVTAGVYAIINDQRVADNHAEFTSAWLRDILKGERYPVNHQSMIVEMMKRFELCHQFKNEDRFLLPSLLPQEEPPALPTPPPGSLRFILSYKILIRNIISRFIVQTGDMIDEGRVWRDGVVLNDGHNQAMVVSERHNRRISIAVWGTDATRREFLTKLRGKLDTIHGSLPGLDFEERVPIPEYPGVDVAYEYLLLLNSEGVEEFFSEQALVKVQVKPLLEGIDQLPSRRGEGDTIIKGDYIRGNKTMNDEVWGDKRV